MAGLIADQGAEGGREGWWAQDLEVGQGPLCKSVARRTARQRQGVATGQKNGSVRPTDGVACHPALLLLTRGERRPDCTCARIMMGLGAGGTYFAVIIILYSKNIRALQREHETYNLLFSLKIWR